MAKEKLEDLGLEEGTVESTDKKIEKVQTPEELAMIVAGMEKVNAFGVSAKFAQVMALVPVWNSGDKDALATAKETVINQFGGSESLKDYVDADFQSELNAILGTAKVGSILNNIKSFYARRARTAKSKTIQVNIAGTIYAVDANYYNEIASVSKEEKRELLLAHAGTKVMENIPEIL